MDLKFYLNKIIKIDNIENYTLKSLQALKTSYNNFIEKSEGVDPDFPLLNFGDKGKKIKGVNKFRINNEQDDLIDDINSLF